MPCPKNLLQFYNQRKSGRRRIPFFVFHVFIISSSSRLSGGVFLSLSSQAGLQLNVLYVCREHVLGIINFLSSLGRMWVL